MADMGPISTQSPAHFSKLSGELGTALLGQDQKLQESLIREILDLVAENPEFSSDSPRAHDGPKLSLPKTSIADLFGSSSTHSSNLTILAAEEANSFEEEKKENQKKSADSNKSEPEIFAGASKKESEFSKKENFIQGNPIKNALNTDAYSLHRNQDGSAAVDTSSRLSGLLSSLAQLQTSLQNGGMQQMLARAAQFVASGQLSQNTYDNIASLMNELESLETQLVNLQNSGAPSSQINALKQQIDACKNNLALALESAEIVLDSLSGLGESQSSSKMEGMMLRLAQLTKQIQELAQQRMELQHEKAQKEADKRIETMKQEAIAIEKKIKEAEKLSGIMKIIKWVVVALSVVAAALTGGALSFLVVAATTLDVILKETTGFSVTEKLVEALAKAFGSEDGQIVNENGEADAAAIAATAIVVLISLILAGGGAGALSNLFGNLAKNISNVATKIAPKMMEALTKMGSRLAEMMLKVSDKLTTALPKLTQAMQSIRAVGQTRAMNAATTVTQAAGEGAQQGIGVKNAEVNLDIAKISAVLKSLEKVLELLQEWSKTLFRLVQDAFEAASRVTNLTSANIKATKDAGVSVAQRIAATGA